MCGGGLQDQKATSVAADGTVTDGPQVAIGGIIVIDVPSGAEALHWAAKFTVACRCAQEIWELWFDPQLDAMHWTPHRTMPAWDSLASAAAHRMS